MDLREIASQFKRIDCQSDPEAICNPQVREAYTLYNSALEKLSSGNNAEARGSLRKATQLKSDFDDAYILLGLCIFSFGNRIDAMRTFNQIKDSEKHQTAMKYFDMLSQNSKDVVTGYKAQQTYKDTVRPAAISLFEDYSDESPEENVVPPEEFDEEVFDDDDVEIDIQDNTLGFESSIYVEEPVKKAVSVDYFEEFAEDTAAVEHNEVSGGSVFRISGADEEDFFEDFSVSLEKKEEQKPQEEKIVEKKRNEKPLPKRSTGMAARRAIVIVFCLAVLAILAFVVALSGKDTLFKGNSPKGTALLSTETPSEKPAESEATKITEKPTVAPTEVPTEVPAGVLAAEASKKLDEASALLKSRSFYECYILIKEYDWKYLPSEKVSVLNSVRDSAYSEFCRNYYNNMYSNVDKDWEKVIYYGLILIEHCPDYDRGGGEARYVYFHVAKAYDETGDKVNAEKYYKYTVENYPDTDCCRWATYKLSRL